MSGCASRPSSASLPVTLKRPSAKTAEADTQTLAKHLPCQFVFHLFYSSIFLFLAFISIILFLFISFFPPSAETNTGLTVNFSGGSGAYSSTIYLTCDSKASDTITVLAFLFIHLFVCLLYFFLFFFFFSFLFCSFFFFFFFFFFVVVVVVVVAVVVYPFVCVVIAITIIIHTPLAECERHGQVSGSAFDDAECVCGAIHKAKRAFCRFCNPHHRRLSRCCLCRRRDGVQLEVPTKNWHRNGSEYRILEGFTVPC